MMNLKTILLVSYQIVSTFGRPIPLVPSQSQDSPETLHNLQDNAEGLLYLSKGIIQETFLLETTLTGLRNGKYKPVSTLKEAMASLASMPNASDHTTIELATELITRGLAPTNILDIINGLTDSQINSIYNDNPRNPEQLIYPKRNPEDAPYDKTEDELRSAIRIPHNFQYGSNGKRPVLLVPGTSDPTGTTYYFSYEKLLADTDFADPIWVNIPDHSLGDIQVVSEYVAYAINYVSAISKTKIGVISWSQGGIDVQWALRYWPSTRDAVEDFMPISPDFHGTLFEYACVFPNRLCTPSIRQQGYESNLIHALRNEDGDSAYVPTTSVYSGVDEIVQPQSDPNASGTLKDVRRVGVTNTQIQLACPGKPAGGFYTHEAMLVNPIAYALFVDALTHDGPGELSRIDLDTVCDQIVPLGLGLDDLLGTEAMAVIYGIVDTLSYGESEPQEPPLKYYV
ncbi:hypothetical protein N7478_006776 [Penicillium angulare]|uniref:uncharacterized protein n=1 Tax=Penicillium angulare TaxID=116970 RepID=UPI0025421C6D|nr:uncharacterized protein N7478_006776 [Penicillium angulare]KAJ5281404.1 hypothetical protein N7478_006776 [Penicillium angulare]